MTLTPRLPALVLIIGPEGLESLGPTLVKAGYRVAGARSAAEGFDKAIALVPDFILLYPDVLDATVARLRDGGTTKHIRVIPVSGPPSMTTEEVVAPCSTDSYTSRKEFAKRTTGARTTARMMDASRTRSVLRSADGPALNRLWLRCRTAPGVLMAERTRDNKRRARITRLLAELQMKDPIDAHLARRRCQRIRLALVELLRAESRHPKR